VYVADGSSDQYILSTDTSGSVLWAASFGDPLGFETANAIIRGAAGSTIVAGSLSGLAGLDNNCCFLTIGPNGAMAGLHAYSDAEAEGLLVRDLRVDPQGGGFIATGLRLDAETFILAPTSIIPFSYEGIEPAAGVDYGFFFDDWAQGEEMLFSAGFFTDLRQQSIEGRTETVPAGSSAAVVGIGTFSSLTVGSQDAGITAEPFEAVEEDHEGRLDGQLTGADFDMFFAGLNLAAAP
jgi:hypothetical protein